MSVATAVQFPELPAVVDKPVNLSVKLPIDVVESARIIVAIEGGTITDLLGDLLRPLLTKMERAALAKREKDGRGREGK